MNYKKNELNKMKDIKKIRTVLLDDAPFINDSFEILLGYSFPFIEVVGKAESVKDGWN
ncbi:MAG: hypothetical protein NTW25_13055 [Candidatus Kapabacteria bacterium]|nr:hypothetical protein [Candidatus Kapabacteria bacterium]